MHRRNVLPFSASHSTSCWEWCSTHSVVHDVFWVCRNGWRHTYNILKNRYLSAQRDDQTIGPIVVCKQSKEKPTREQFKSFSVQTKCLLCDWEKLTFDGDGILQRKTATRTQLVLLEKYKSTVLRQLHNEIGHQGVERTTSLIRDRFYWPDMQREIEHYVTQSCTCLKQKKPCRESRAPLVPIVTTQTFKLVSIDFLHLDKCRGGYEYILLTADHYTRYAQAYPTT